MADENNPIRLTYDALWNCLEAEPDFKTMFPPNTPHQIRYNTALEYKADPMPALFVPAVLPACRIYTPGCATQLHLNACDTEIQVRFRVETFTGQPMQQVMMDAMWNIIRGYANYFTYLVDAVEWNSGNPVKHVQDETMEATNAEKDLSRGIPQWVLRAQCSVFLVFATSDLRT